MEKLNTAFQAASQDMYNASQPNGTDPSQANANTDTSKKPNDEEVTDVDFEEV